MRNPLVTARQPAALFYNGIGDHLLALPTLRALAHLFPGRLQLILDRNAPLFLFEELNSARLVEVTFVRNGHLRYFDAVSVAGSVEPCDLLISLVPWKSPSLNELLMALRPKHSIGFSSEFSVPLLYAGSIHAADSAFRVAKAMSKECEIFDFARPLQLPDQNRHDADAIRKSFSASEKLLVVHTVTGRQKTWPRRLIDKLLGDFVERHPEFGICVVGQTTPRAAEHPRISECFDNPLATCFALVARSDLFLGVDSCMLHAADLCRIPSVGLFGPTRTIEWGLRFTSGVNLQGDCSMESISAEWVMKALEWTLANRGRLETWVPEQPEK
jgi:ADP-heptose:LPS heptosyltransferase